MCATLQPRLPSWPESVIYGNKLRLFLIVSSVSSLHLYFCNLFFYGVVDPAPKKKRLLDHARLSRVTFPDCAARCDISDRFQEWNSMGYRLNLEANKRKGKMGPSSCVSKSIVPGLRMPSGRISSNQKHLSVWTQANPSCNWKKHQDFRSIRLTCWEETKRRAPNSGEGLWGVSLRLCRIVGLMATTSASGYKYTTLRPWDDYQYLLRTLKP